MSAGGRPSVDALASLHEVRQAGRRLLLVTGRILAELRSVFPDAARFFDVIVGENGAVLAREAGIRRLVTPVPLALDEALLHRGIPFRRGQVLLASTMVFAPIVLEEISRLGLECQIVHNRAELMVVPSSVTKGTGLSAALAELGVSAHDTVGLGDAENDHTLLDACELGVAVANAVPSLKAHADLVLPDPAERGVVGFLRGRVLRGDERVVSRRRRVALGRREDGSLVDVPASGVNVLVRGAPLSGKSFAAGLLVEGLIDLGYSVCVIDPEGDHLALAMLHRCITVGGHHPLPSPEQLADVFRHTFGSVVVDLSLLPESDRVEWSAQLLDALQQQRERSGFPHWIVFDEAQLSLCAGGPASSLLRPEQKGLCLVSYRPERLCACAQESLDLVITTEGDGRARLEAAGAGDAGASFELGERITAHVRHRHKYAHAALPPERRFYFRGAEGSTGRSAGSLEEFDRELRGGSASVLRHHAARHDFSRWVDGVLQDVALARRLRAIEDRARESGTASQLEELRAEILDAVQARYLG